MRLKTILKEQEEIKSEVTGSYSNQTDILLSLYTDNQIVATLAYSEYLKKPFINYINVLPEHRRKGYAKKLLKKLQDNYPKEEIRWGSLTPDGAKLKDSVKFKTIRNDEIADKVEKIKKLSEQLVEVNDVLYKLFGKRDRTEDDTKLLSKLFDKQTNLEYAIENLERQIYLSDEKEFKNIIENIV
jgi:predicted acetyltransferase